LSCGEASPHRLEGRGLITGHNKFKEDHMPQETHNNQKAKSPSKLIQQGIDQSWGRQQDATTDPKKALAQKETAHPKKP